MELVYNSREERAEYVWEKYGEFLPDSVLDVGCGNAHLRKYIARNYTGVDFTGNPDIRIDLEQGELRETIHNYRRAVEMEADYVDERTPLFIGNEIKKLVTEGREKFSREKALKPKDKEVRKALKDVYYLQSRLAGGCE